MKETVPKPNQKSIDETLMAAIKGIVIERTELEKV
jgi:hypothetical protein